MQLPTQVQDGSRGGWWWWQRDPQERAARQAYHQSLPALYRWRRVLATVVAIALVGGLALFLGRDPVGRVQDLWQRLTSNEDTVPGLASSSDTVARLYHADGATDNDDDTAWATKWPRQAAHVRGCGSSMAGSLTLRWPTPANVAHIEVLPGAHDGDNQFLPKRLDFAPPHGRCVAVKLKDLPEWQKFPVNFRHKVRVLRVTVASVYPNQAEPPERLVAISEIRPLTKDPGE